MEEQYIRGCENSTLANVLTPFCTALGVQTPLYRDRILYRIGVAFCTELHRNTCMFCDAIHNGYVCSATVYRKC